MSNKRNPELRFRARPEFVGRMEALAKLYEARTGEDVNLSAVTRMVCKAGLTHIIETYGIADAINEIMSQSKA